MLDGEAIGWLDDGARRRCSRTRCRRSAASTGDAGAGLGARFFDVLHVDGEDLLDRPLRERLDGARPRAPAPPPCPRLVTADAEVAAAFADDALARGHEGVMVKALDSPYDAGRRGGSWRKVKPVRTLDLVVLAVEWGSGRRQGWLSNLRLGARAARRATAS